MGDSTAERKARAQAVGSVHPESCEGRRGGSRAGGRLNPDVNLTIGGDRPPRLGGDVVTFNNIREFLAAFSEYEHWMHVAN